MMCDWRSLLNVRLWLAVIAAGVTNTLAPPPSWANDFVADGDRRTIAGGNQSSVSQALPTPNIPRLNDSKRPATTLKEWLSQSPPEISDSPIQVTGVQLNPTENGLEVILETTAGEKLQPSTRSEGNTLIGDIPNSQLVLPSGKNEFRADNPVAGIIAVSVIQVNDNSIRVTVTGEAGVPQFELFDSDEGLIFGVTTVASSTQQGQQPQTQPTPPEQPGSETQPSEPSEEEIEIVVTGEQDTGYNVPDASTATRTDTPIRDIPQSIQVVPRQVLEDRNVQRELEALETVSGVVDFNTRPTNLGSQVYIRGFFSPDSLRNGLHSQGFTPIGTIERVEVLKGPASVLYGALEPGGVVNYVTCPL